MVVYYWLGRLVLSTLDLFKYTPSWHAPAGAGLAFLFRCSHLAMISHLCCEYLKLRFARGWFAVLCFGFYLLFLIVFLLCFLKELCCIDYWGEDLDYLCDYFIF
jgi:hypothetical protein